jgi:hypothetical protein
VGWEVECADIDPQQVQQMEELAMNNLVEKIGKVFFGVKGRKLHCYGLKIGKEST